MSLENQDTSVSTWKATRVSPRRNTSDSVFWGLWGMCASAPSQAGTVSVKCLIVTLPKEVWLGHTTSESKRAVLWNYIGTSLEHFCCHFQKFGSQYPFILQLWNSICVHLLIARTHIIVYYTIIIIIIRTVMFIHSFTHSIGTRVAKAGVN